MSGQNLSSNHCSRTYWTPTMERYFVDLMLEHIHRGNRIGHTFNKQAWTDMLAVFNAKFGSQYDKDVLKGRYTNLWKLFNDVKNLLGQKGFSWDETRQMVVADDYVWEAYIKINPEARPYRTKSVLNFDDLCLIYGYTVADGRYSRSSHDVDFEDENPGAHLGERNSNLASSTSSRTDWTPDMDQYFIELMLKQQERGNKLDSTFTKQAWTEMLALFNAKFSSEYNKRVLRHRYKKLWKYYCDLMTLVKQKGFVWDEKQEMVVAHNNVWDAYMKAHPHARSYRAKVFPGYNNLALIFGEMTSKESQIDCHQDKDIKSEAVVAKAGSERSRTYWTPPMDRFFIDLMLDQVHGGNRIGPSFITQAWNDMVESFNANFNSHHDREVLKNRYKHFRKQYNDVRILLQHKGFSWDEGREMLTAEDHVWDAYIKAHPDARSYRVKTVPCYHKLCVIYGQDKFDGSYSCLVGSTDPAVGTFCMKIGNGKREESHAGADPITDWSYPMEQYFVDLMLEQVLHGNKIDNEFGEQAWAHMTLSFKEKFGLQYEQHILENRYLSLMKQYIEISNLLNEEGFLWDEASHTIVGDSDTWESYAKEHPEAVSYKDKVVRYYSELCAIFGPADLVDVKASSEMVMELDQHPVDMKVDKYSGDLPVTLLETEIYDQVRKRTASTSLESCNKAQKTGKKKAQGTYTNVTSMATELVNKEAGNKYFAIESAIDALQAISDIDDEPLLEGCDLLEDERKAKTFLALDATLRKKWLLRKLGRS
ncbi:L10-interacting MYB domain-containing protein isoform X1 [Sesamum indicum]|uniref:L10-interacting MYB domain-containing protein isoform X1 n=1 Tax=Sesamum indicum TaxID=4182 RepID=A0A6I9TLW7_SESIN|nr:L10-interacting MYB domain-containing protein isoform X1 [Sesamum indicum]XP_011081987.1 L10-interacting MYB domain-containing protein isoform X1 [Sesamum indicum]